MLAYSDICGNPCAHVGYCFLHADFFPCIRQVGNGYSRTAWCVVLLRLSISGRLLYFSSFSSSSRGGETCLENYWSYTLWMTFQDLNTELPFGGELQLLTIAQLESARFFTHWMNLDASALFETCRRAEKCCFRVSFSFHGQSN